MKKRNSWDKFNSSGNIEISDQTFFLIFQTIKPK